MLLGLVDDEIRLDVVDHFYARPENYGALDHNLSGLARWEQRWTDDTLVPASRVCVLSAGGGREVIALARAGFRVEGFECSPVLVASAQKALAESGAEASVSYLAPDTAPVGTWDAVLIGWGGYMHVIGRANRVAFLRGVRACLPTGAPLLLSFIARSENGRQHRAIAAGANVLRRLRGKPAVEVGDDFDPVWMHRVNERELRHELGQTGFELESFEPHPYGHAVGRSR